MPKQKVCGIIKGMKCKRCEKENKQIKAGEKSVESQIYKCKHCGKTYTPKPKERNYSEEVKNRQ